MTEDELYFVIEHQEGYYPSFVKMAWKKIDRMLDEPYPISEKEAMMNAIINILEEMGSYCRVNENDEIFFVFRGAEFSIRFDTQYNYIEILDNSWKKIHLNDSVTAQKVAETINKANIFHSVTIFYLTDEEEQVMEIIGSSNIPYFTNLTYLKNSLIIKLSDMLDSHDFVDYYLEDEDFSINQSRSKHTASKAN
jgi:hypothetical protein